VKNKAKGTGMKILVVDDEMVSREKMKMIMGHFGQCEAVENGADALGKFVEAWNSWSPYDLISLDVQMPEMDGVEVLNRIRALEREKNVPESKRARVVMVTARSDKDTIMTSIQAGCNDYVVKPFDKAIVAKKLSKLGFQVYLF
jgi:two-component system chemotaxis response regulator CheY